MKGEIIDRKFKFVAVNPCNQKVYTEENAIIFCAKDMALLDALYAYRSKCCDLNCGDEHIESISMLMARVEAFQKDEKRIPDTNTDCEIDRCIGGKV